MYELLLPTITGFLAFIIVINFPDKFSDFGRHQYFRYFRQHNIVVGPSLLVFITFVLLWNTILPVFNINTDGMILIAAAVYLFFIFIYSIVDSYSTYGLIVYFTLLLITNTITYSPTITFTGCITGLFWLFTCLFVINDLHLNELSWDQHLEWYIWYAGTIGGILRCRQ